MDEWLAIDIYPEYRWDALELLNFIKMMNLCSSNILKNKLTNN